MCRNCTDATCPVCRAVVAAFRWDASLFAAQIAGALVANAIVWGIVFYGVHHAS